MLNQPLMSVNTRQAAAWGGAVLNNSLREYDLVADIARRILQASAYHEVRALTCEHHDGALILRGRVSSWYQKQLTQESVRRLPGIDLIVNAVEVLAPSRSERRSRSFTVGPI